MCKEFSCIMLPNGSILDGRPLPNKGVTSWTHSHSEILRRHNLKDENPTGNSFARIEIDLTKLYSKRETDLSDILSWVKIDQSITPIWFKDRHRKLALRAFQSYLKVNLKHRNNLVLHDNTVYRLHVSSRNPTCQPGSSIYSHIMVGSHKFKKNYPYKNPLYKKTVLKHRARLKEWSSSNLKNFTKSFPLK